MVTLHYWKASAEAESLFGHVGVMVEPSAPRAPFYVTWWPRRPQGLVFCSPSLTPTLEMDGRAEGRESDTRERLAKLDENAIVEWWQKLIKDAPQWCTFSFNCSTVCAKCLLSGARGVADDFVAAVYSPGSVLDIARTLKRRLNDYPPDLPLAAYPRGPSGSRLG